jgi:TolB protein
VNKAVAAFGLAGFAAAAAISTLQTPSAPAHPTHIRITASRGHCSAGSHTGQAVQTTAYLKVDGKPSKTKSRFLRPGQRVGTTGHGNATVCLRLGSTHCDLAAGTDMRLLPSASTLALLQAGQITCSTRVVKDKGWTIKTKKQTIKLGALGLSSRARHGLAAVLESGLAAASSGHLLSVSVRANRTTVKVRRGLTVVARDESLKNGVVVGRDKQVTVSSTQDPPDATAIHLNAAERRAFADLQATLPPLRDKTPPGVRIIRAPHNPSSTRVPRFEFDATEAGAVFSFSLDGGTFRVCARSQQLPNVSPGAHRLAVTAIDSTGNPSPPVVFEWTVDSSMILFTREEGGNREIYSMDPAGGGQRNLTNNAAEDSAATWSPDGRLIAFHTDRDRQFEIYVMDANGTNLRRLTFDPAFDKNPAWSPDGKQLVFESARDGNSDLYVMDSEGGNVRRLTTDPAADYDPAWSPDGTRIAFASRRRGGNNDIWVMNADGSNQTSLDEDPHIEYNPAWSPDSKTIAFHSDRLGGSSQIWFMNADGTSPHRLTQTSQGTGAFDYNPVWAPDGETLAFQSNLRGNYDIYIINVDGSDLTRLTDSPFDDLVPDW